MRNQDVLKQRKVGGWFRNQDVQEVTEPKEGLLQCWDRPKAGPCRRETAYRGNKLFRTDSVT